MEHTIDYEKNFFSVETNYNEIILPAFKAVDPVSALTHFIGFLLSLAGLPVLLTRAAGAGHSTADMISFSIYMMTMIMLYGASASYHSFNTRPGFRIVMQKLDHAMIFFMIAGSYTPMCTVVLDRAEGLPLLAAVWGITIVGLLFVFFWIDCPRWVSSIVYIAMGWSAIFVLSKLYHSMSLEGFILLTSGGVAYTVGGIIYSMNFKLPGKLSDVFGPHEVFHLFVMLGSALHFAMMLLYVAA